MNNDIEMLEMKEQLQALKAQLEKTTTLHEDTLRKQIKKGGSALYNREIVSIIFVGLVTFILPPVLYFMQGLGLPFCLFTLLFFLFALAWEIYYFRSLKLAHLQDCDLVTTEKNMQKYRRLNRIWLLYIGLPFIAVWMSWFFYEQISHLQAVSGETLSPMLIACIIGSGLIGGLIGGLVGLFKFYLPQMKQAKEIIEQIHDLEA